MCSCSLSDYSMMKGPLLAGLTAASILVTMPLAYAAKEAPAFNAKEHTDWGTYYDPKSIFCGNFDCYKILGFDFEDYGSPDPKEITKRYRALGREWHPDKSKHKEAKERFVVSPGQLENGWMESINHRSNTFRHLSNERNLHSYE